LPLARAVSPKSAQATQNTSPPRISIAQKDACQPNPCSNKPPKAGLIIGTSAMPMVT